MVEFSVSGIKVAGSKLVGSRATRLPEKSTESSGGPEFTVGFRVCGRRHTNVLNSCIPPSCRV